MTRQAEHTEECGQEKKKRKLTFQRCLGSRTARCSFLRSEREVSEEEAVEVNSAVNKGKNGGG